MADHGRWNTWLGFLSAIASGVIIAAIVGEGRFSAAKREQPPPNPLSSDASSESPVPTPPTSRSLLPVQGNELPASAEGQQEEVSREIQNPGTNIDTPVDAVRKYWAALSSQDYIVAWSGLSESFKTRNHPGGYSDYVDGHRAMRVCSIVIGDATFWYLNDGSPVVSADVWFQAGSTCRTSKEAFFFYMRSSSVDEWLIDHVAKR